MREAAKNGEPELGRCEGCPIGDGTCPELDDLSKSVLAFGAIWDHPAHEGYRDALSPLLGPFLSPAEAVRWVARRQRAWDEAEAIRAEERKAEMDKHKPPEAT